MKSLGDSDLKINLQQRLCVNVDFSDKWVNSDRSGFHGHLRLALLPVCLQR